MLLKCHADCATADVKDADGLDWGDLFPDGGKRNGRVEVATYDYTDEHGERLFQCVRFHPKDFRQRRPDGRGGWVWNLKGVRRVLYRLPRVIEAVKAGATIYVVEGERDVHALERVGQVATCNPMGAGKWRREYAEALRGAEVMIVADRDDAGRRHAQTAAGSLHGVAASVTIVEAAVGKDAAEHLAAGRTAEEFVPIDPHGGAHAPRGPAWPGDLSRPVIEAIERYQVIEDTDAIRATLAAAVTSVLDDEPLWLQLVGGSSSGKSEMIAMLRGVADGRIGEVTVAGLLGWSGSGKNAKPIGLLSRVGDGHKLVTITDFSTVLADSDRGRRAGLFSFLRTLYDGYAIREINSAPRPLEWEGRLTIVSGVTPQIDAFSAHADALGPRWMYCRVPELSRAGRKRAATRARQNASGKEQLRAEVRDRATEAIDQARERVAGIEINDIDGDWLDEAAIVTTLGRADVPRNGYGRREIVGEVTREEPPRVAIMLAIMFRGLRAVGVPQRSARRIAMRCAVDSVPLTRRRVLDELRGGEVLNTSEVTRRTGADRKVVRFALEELELLGVVESKRIGGTAAGIADDHPDAREQRPRDWRLTGEDGKLVARVLDEVGRNVEEISPSPPK